MSEQVAAEAVFLHRLAVRAAVAVLIVGEAPFCQVPGRDAETNGEGAEALRPAEPDVDGQTVVVVGKALNLAAEVGYHSRQRQVALGVVVVDAQVGGKGKSRVVGVARIYKFQRRATAQAVGDVVRIVDAEADVLGREGAEDVAAFVGLFH